MNKQFFFTIALAFGIAPQVVAMESKEEIIAELKKLPQEERNRRLMKAAIRGY